MHRSVLSLLIAAALVAAPALAREVPKRKEQNGQPAYTAKRSFLDEARRENSIPSWFTKMFAPELAERSRATTGKEDPPFSLPVSTLALAWSRDARTLDCGCSFGVSAYGKNYGKIDPASCPYTPRIVDDANNDVVWAHIVPLETAFAGRACMAQGVEACLKTDPEARQMGSDLFNVAPMLHEIAVERGTRRYGEIPGAAQPYGACTFAVDHRGGIVQPPADRRGEIARAYLYMHDTWKVSFPAGQLDMFRRWNAEDPPKHTEVLRALQIGKAQGHLNPYVTNRNTGQ